MTILQRDGNVFQFEAFDDVTGDPADIDLIEIDPGATGTVHIMIERDPQVNPTGNGARNVREINLSGPTNSRISQLDITGDLGELGPIVADTMGFSPSDWNWNIDGDLRNAVTVDVADGWITVEGNVLAAASINIAGDLIKGIFIRGEHRGSIVIGGDVLDSNEFWISIRKMVGGAITCRDMNLRTQNGGGWMVIGDGIDVFELQNTTHTGSINILGELSGRVFVRGKSALDIDVATINAAEDFNAGGASQRRGGLETTTGFTSVSDITIGTFTQGRIGFFQNLNPAHIPDALRGAISVTGNMLSNAEIGTTQTATANPVLPLDVLADITVGGNLSGDILSTRHMSGDISVSGAFSGEVRTVGTASLSLGNISGDLSVGGAASGDIAALEDISGDISIDGNLTSSALIQTGQI